jgi:hypothetical protein
MSRFLELLDKYQDQEETESEAEELARLLKEDEGRAQTFYDALMLEVDLYESYAGIARIQAAPKRRWRLRQWVLAWAVAVFLIIGLVTALMLGSPKPPQAVPVAPAAPKKTEIPLPAPEPPKPAPLPGKRVYKEDHEEHEEHEKGGRRAEIEREMDKEIEKARRRGNLKEVEEKLREKERKLKNLEQRGHD